MSIGCLVLFTGFVHAQTTINAGSVNGTWNKAGSPYKVNGDIFVPRGQTLHIAQGVKVEFQGSYTLHVWGSIQAIGAANDTVVLTGSTSSTLWGGVYIHKNQAGADSNLFKYCLFQYAKFIDYTMSTNVARGALRCDTITNISIENSRFYKNVSNIGAGIRGLRSNLQIKNCLFHYNTAIDERTNLPSGAFGGGSAIVLGIGTIVIDNCQFRDNLSHAPNDPKDTTVGLGQGVVVLTDASISLLNSSFINNTCTQGYTIRLAPVLSNNKSFIFKNCDFINNTNGFEPLFQIDNNGYSNIQTTIDNCRFIGNSITRADYQQICIFVYNSGGGGNKVSIDNCLFYKNNSSRTRPNVIGMNNSVDAAINNCRFIGNKAQAILFYRDGKLKIDNSLFSNNYEAITCGLQSFTSNILVFNSLFVNNAIPAADSAKFKGSLYYMPNHTLAIVGPDNANIYNSVFWGNLGDNGKPANLLTENKQAGGKINLLQNNYIQWGTASTSNNKGGQANIITKNNIYTDTLIFVKPSLGSGPAYADTTADWHIINTCVNVPATYNKGFAAIKDGSGASVTLPSTDLEGQARIQQDTLDIGPYEISGLKARTVLRTIPGTDSICFSDKKLLKSKWDGMGLTFTWEKSPDGINNWQTIQIADSSNYLAAPIINTYYRIKAGQAECGRINTSPAFLFKVRPLPQMLKAPVGDSACPGYAVHLGSLWNGGQLVYTWEKSTDGASNWQMVQTADSADLHFNPSGNSYYRIRVKSQGCSKDSVSNTIAVGLFPVPKPNLGRDSSIKQNQSLMLNPGNFSSYQWNTGVSTSTLTINGAAEPLGTKSYSVIVTNQYGCKNSDTVNITIEKNTAIAAIESLSWKIYPIPSHGVLNISPADGRVYTYILMDMQGKTLIREEDSGTGQITGISPGQYLLIIETENEVKKVMVMVQ